MSDLAIDPGAVAELDRLLSDPAALAGKLQELADAARAEHAAQIAAIDAAMEKLLAAKAEQATEFDRRDRELRQRENALMAAESQLAADRDRVYARERMVEMRAADMQVRYAGAK